MLSYFACLIGMFSPVSVTYSDAINIENRHIKVSDVVDLSGVDSSIKNKLAEKIIATIPSGKSNVTLTRRGIADLIRKRIPGLPLDENHKNNELIRIEYSEIDKSVNKQKCHNFKRPVSKGKAITAADLSVVPCDQNRELAAMKYNTLTSVLRATNDISAGSYAGSTVVTAIRYADTDDELVLRVVVGPVKIEKIVWALQPANGADRIFVKDRQGNVLRVPIQSPISQEEKK